MKKAFYGLLCMALLFLCACQKELVAPNAQNAVLPTNTEQNTTIDTQIPQIAKDDTASESRTANHTVFDETSLIRQFFKDAKVPEDIQKNFEDAIRGVPKAQKWILEYYDPNSSSNLDWVVADAVLPFRNITVPYLENECFYNIGLFYYLGNDYIFFLTDKTKAFEWFKISAGKGNPYGAMQAGDMARDGDGIPADAEAAFEFHTKAASLAVNGAFMERLGDCYAKGIGTTSDKQKACEYYIDSALTGHYPGFYKLSTIVNDAYVNMTALYKAASSLNYSGGYWAMAYDGLGGYSANDAKLYLMAKLSNIWENGIDFAAQEFRKSISYNEYFPESFVEALLRAMYSYSYHDFAEEYGLWPNRTHDDAGNISFARFPADGDEYLPSQPERYLSWDGCAFYYTDKILRRL